MSKQEAAAVVKALLTEIVPRWGIPRKISSDNGTHFVNEAIKQVGQFLGIERKTVGPLRNRRYFKEQIGKML